MARKTPTFMCYECDENIGSASGIFSHFQANPEHRNEKQQKDYVSNKALRDSGYMRKANKKRKTNRIKAHRRNGKLHPIGKLPTIKAGGRRDATRIELKFCTDCGGRRKHSDVFCGGCGNKLR